MYSAIFSSPRFVCIEKLTRTSGLFCFQKLFFLKYLFAKTVTSMSRNNVEEGMHSTLFCYSKISAKTGEENLSLLQSFKSSMTAGK